MHHEYHRWFSPALDRHMALEVVGHHGARVLVFPTSMGTHREWIDRRRHEVLADNLESGWLQLFLLDHLPSETWVRRGGPCRRAGLAPPSVRSLPPKRGAALHSEPQFQPLRDRHWCEPRGVLCRLFRPQTPGSGAPDSGHERALRHQTPHRRLFGPQRLRLQPIGLHAPRARSNAAGGLPSTGHHPGDRP